MIRVICGIADAFCTFRSVRHGPWPGVARPQRPQLPAAGNSENKTLSETLWNVLWNVSKFFDTDVGSLPDPWLRGKSHICREFHLTVTSRCHRLSGHDTQESCKPELMILMEFLKTWSLASLIIPWYYALSCFEVIFKALTKTCETWRNFDVRPHLLPQWTRLRPTGHLSLLTKNPSKNIRLLCKAFNVQKLKPRMFL